MESRRDRFICKLFLPPGGIMDKDKISTKSLGRNFVDVPQEFILEDKPKTRTVFKAEMHSGGVRGHIIRYKKNSNGSCVEIVPTNFNELHSEDGVKIDLPTSALQALYDKITELNQLLATQGIRYGEREYVVTDASSLIITDANKASIIKQLLDKNYGEDVWYQFAEANPDIATRLAFSQIQLSRTQVLEKFEEMLCDESLSEGEWQSFFDENKWIFGYGLRYQMLNITQSQPNYGGVDFTGRGFERGDYLTHTEGDVKFTCLVEIKRPSSALMQPKPYRNGAWAISDELAGAIAQVQANCAEWEISGSRSDQNRDALPDIYTVSPKGIVIIGRASQLDNRVKRNSFERFRQSLHNPEVLTFDELYERAKFIVGQVGTSDMCTIEEDDFPF